MRRYTLIMCLILAILTLCGCYTKGSDTESEYYLYYINQQENKLVKQAYTPEGKETKELIEEFIIELDDSSAELEYNKVIPDNINIIEYELQDKQLSINFNSEYLQLDHVTEVFLRAGVVKTLVQISGVEYVSFLIDSSPLMDSSGNPVGVMTADSFIETTGGGINSYQYASLTLYFANETGDKLVKDIIEVHYSTNKSLEQLVVEQLIKGPAESRTDLYPMISSDSKILSVTVKDGICYVNLDDKFLGITYDVNADIPIYAIVNSLSDTCNVNKIRISINGETNINYREHISLDGTFERNPDIIDVPETEAVTESESTQPVSFSVGMEAVIEVGLEEAARTTDGGTNE